MSLWDTVEGLRDRSDLATVEAVHRLGFSAQLNMAAVLRRSLSGGVANLPYVVWLDNTFGQSLGGIDWARVREGLKAGVPEDTPVAPHWVALSAWLEQR